VAGTAGAANIRSGRARLSNAYGSELLDLPLDLRLQFWVGAALGWQSNATDTCTAIQASDFAFAFAGAGNNLSACETAMTIGGAAPNYTATLTRPGAGNAGWSDVTLNLGAAAAGNRCTAVGAAGPAATTANAPWLQFNWAGAVGNPTARATFGRYKTPLIYRRENY
jgi:MSHA biogenesis protein MshQ